MVYYVNMTEVTQTVITKEPIKMVKSGNTIRPAIPKSIWAQLGIALDTELEVKIDWKKKVLIIEKISLFFLLFMAIGVAYPNITTSINGSYMNLNLSDTNQLIITVNNTGDLAKNITFYPFDNPFFAPNNFNLTNGDSKNVTMQYTGVYAGVFNIPVTLKFYYDEGGILVHDPLKDQILNFTFDVANLTTNVTTNNTLLEFCINYPMTWECNPVWYCNSFPTSSVCMQEPMIVNHTEIIYIEKNLTLGISEDELQNMLEREVEEQERMQRIENTQALLEERIHGLENTTNITQNQTAMLIGDVENLDEKMDATTASTNGLIWSFFGFGILMVALFLGIRYWDTISGGLSKEPDVEGFQ